MGTFTGYYGIDIRNERFDLASQTNNQFVDGGEGSDYIGGGSRYDILFGGNGADFVYGGDGPDRILGDFGTHIIGGGNDQLAGGNGDDFVSGGSGDDIVEGGEGIDDVFGNDGNDLLWGSFGTDNTYGGAGNDAMYGGSEAASSGRLTFSVTVQWDGLTDLEITPQIWTLDVADASSDLSSDYMDGGSGDDLLFGQGGDDDLTGNLGRDQLFGGGGADFLNGGSDADVFVFELTTDSTRAVRDAIADFSHNQRDKLSLSLIDANTKASGNQKFTFIGDDPFTEAGQVRFFVSKGNTYVEANVNGDKKPDFSVLLYGTHDLLSKDFIL